MKLKRDEQNTLRDYQWDMVADAEAHIMDGEQRVAIVSPTGSGKTLMCGFLISRLLKTPRFRAVVVASPLSHIQDQFMALEGRWEARPKYMAGSHSVIETNLDGLWSRRAVDESGRLVVAAHLAAATVPLRPALNITHHALAIYGDDVLPQNLSGCLLVLDEAHHIGWDWDTDTETPEGTKIAAFAEAWVQRGGTVLYVTATPYRSDGLRIYPEGTPVVIRSVTEHASEGFCPNDFQAETLFSGFEATTKGEFEGGALPRHEAEHGIEYTRLVDRWDSVGRPKAVVLVPPRRSKRWAAKLTEALEERGVRVLSVVGQGKKIQRKLTKALEMENGLSDYNDSQIDVIIACKRFDEATNWKMCSHVLCIGIPQSFRLIAQRWGRTMRNKANIANYPPEFINVANITFLVPKLKEGVLAKFQRQYHEMIFLVGAYLTDYTVAAEVRVEHRVRLSKHWQRPKTLEDAVRQSRLRQAAHVTDDERTQARVDLARIVANAEDGSTLSDVVEAVDAKTSFAHTSLLIEHLIAKAPSIADQLDDSILETLADPALLPEQARGRLHSEFVRIIRQYEHNTLPVFDDLIRVVSSFTGQDMQSVVDRLKKMRVWRGDKPLTEQLLLDVADAFHADHGHYKFSGRSATPYIGYEETFDNLDACCRGGCRGLGGGDTYIRLLERHGRLETARPIDWSTVDPDLVVQAISNYVRTHGNMPNYTSRHRIAVTPYADLDTNFTAMNMAVYNARVPGWPRKTTLKLIAIERGLTNPRKKLPTDRIEINELREAVLAADAAGVNHSLTSGHMTPVPTGNPQPWRTVWKMWKKQSGQTKWVFLELTGLRPSPTPAPPAPPTPPLTPEEIIQQLGFDIRNGTPKHLLFMHWNGQSHRINWLKGKCVRGEHGRPPETFEEFLAAMGLALSMPLIEKAVRAFIEREGRGPTLQDGDSTADFGFSTTWSKVAIWLKRHGTTLHDLRLQLHDTRIPIEVVLAGATLFTEQHGRAPRITDGDATPYIKGHGPLTWAAINERMRRGEVKGMPRSVSLHTFLIEHGFDLPRGKVCWPENFGRDALAKGMWAYFNDTGQLPRSCPEDALPHLGFSVPWNAISSMLYQGHFGFPKGSSLACFRDELGIFQTCMHETCDEPARANSQYCSKNCNPTVGPRPTQRPACETCGKDTGRWGRRYCGRDCESVHIRAAVRLYVQKLGKRPTVNSGSAKEYIGRDCQWRTVSINAWKCGLSVKQLGEEALDDANQ